MFNYFYTVEMDFNSEITCKEFSPNIKPMFDNISNVILTSRPYMNEKECVDIVMNDVTKMMGLFKEKYSSDPIIETYPNPLILYGENSEMVSDLSDDEKQFWTDNKLTVFAIFRNKQDTNFLLRYTLYCFEDSIDISNVYSSKFIHENVSKLLN